MRNVKIQWSRKIENTIDAINKSTSSFLKEREAVYMYICAKKINDKWIINDSPLYIGKSYKRQNNETVKNRILEHFNDDIGKCVNKKCNKKVFVKIGKIVLEKNRIFSDKVVKDIECCLINTNLPICNTPCTKNYAGGEVKITNTGAYLPLSEQSHCK